MDAGRNPDELSRTELVMLAMVAANFTAIAAILEILSRSGLLDEREVPLLYDRVSSAIDAVGSQAPTELAAAAQAMIDTAFARILDRTRSRTC